MSSIPESFVMFAAMPGQTGRLSPLQEAQVRCPAALLRLLPRLLRQSPDQRMEEATREGLSLSLIEQQGLHLILQCATTREQQLFWWLRLLNLENYPAQVQRLADTPMRLRLYTPHLQEAGVDLNQLLRQYLGRRLGCRLLQGLLLLGWLLPETLHQALRQRAHWVVTDYQLPAPPPLQTRTPSLSQRQLQLQLQALFDQHPAASTDLVCRLRDRLRHEREPHSLSATAAAMGFSARSLNRYLAALGSSFQEECDQLQWQRALELLRHSGLDACEISQLLGYDNPANFGRACKRWFGHTAGAVQRELEGRNNA